MSVSQIVRHKTGVKAFIFFRDEIKMQPATVEYVLTNHSAERLVFPGIDNAEISNLEVHVLFVERYRMPF